MNQIVKMICLGLILILTTRITAQSKLLFDKPLLSDPQTKFISLNTSHGLSNDRVTAILQDKYGIMWISTLDGINSYNGMEVVSYYHKDNDTLSPQSG